MQGETMKILLLPVVSTYL